MEDFLFCGLRAAGCWPLSELFVIVGRNPVGRVGLPEVDFLPLSVAPFVLVLVGLCCVENRPVCGSRETCARCVWVWPEFGNLIREKPPYAGYAA